MIKCINDWLYKAWYQIKNWKSHARGIILGTTRQIGEVTYQGTLSAKLIRGDGSSNDLGVLCRRSVTNAGVAYMATDFFNGTASIADFDWHASGTGIVAENVTDTGMGTDSGVARVNGTPSNPSAGVYRSVGTMAYVSTLAITEHGIFSASTVGTLWDRSVFTAINVISGDSIQFTYDLTCTAGG